MRYVWASEAFFLPFAFRDMASDLSFLGDIRIENRQFKTQLDRSLFNPHRKYEIPRNSESYEGEKPNHVIFWANDRRAFDFWIIGDFEHGIIHDSFTEDEILKIEDVLLKYRWFTKRTGSTKSLIPSSYLLTIFFILLWIPLTLYDRNYFFTFLFLIILLLWLYDWMLFIRATHKT